MGLNRNDCIGLALLLGSDYTDGISGVGPVNGCVAHVLLSPMRGFSWSSPRAAPRSVPRRGSY